MSETPQRVSAVAVTPVSASERPSTSGSEQGVELETRERSSTADGATGEVRDKARKSSRWRHRPEFVKKIIIKEKDRLPSSTSTSAGDSPQLSSGADPERNRSSEGNMTDADMIDLQQLLRESQEELENLRTENKMLLERLEIQNHLNSNTNDIPGPSSEDKKANSQAALKALKQEYLQLHNEKLQLMMDKEQLLEKLEDKDVQLKQLRKKNSPTGSCLSMKRQSMERSLSTGDLESPDNPKVEVLELRRVIEERDKKIHNLAMQLKSFDAVASGNVTQKEETANLREQLEAAQAEIKKLNDHSEFRTEAYEANESRKSEHDREDSEAEVEDEISAEKKHNQTFQMEIIDLQTQIAQKEVSIKNLVKCRSTLESRLLRAQEERDRLTEQVISLTAAKTNLMGHFDEVKHSMDNLKELVTQLLMTEGSKDEKDAMTKEIQLLNAEVEARKLEADLIREDYEHQNTKLKAKEQKYQEDLHKLDCQLRNLTHESEQKEIKLNIKLDEKTTELKTVAENARACQRELDEQREQLKQERENFEMEHERYKEERDILRSEFNHIHVAQMTKHTAEIDSLQEEQDELQDTVDFLTMKCSGLEDHLRQIEEDALTKEQQYKSTASKCQQLENQLKEKIWEKEALSLKFAALNTQYQHEHIEWQTDQEQWQRAINMHSEQEKTIQHLQNQIEIYKGKFWREWKKTTQLQRDLLQAQKLLQDEEVEHTARLGVMKAECKREKTEANRWREQFSGQQKIIQDLEEKLRQYERGDNLDLYKVKAVQPVQDGNFRANGAYGSVSLVCLDGGVKCIQKRLHNILVGYGRDEDVGEEQKQAVREKFRNECVLLSRMRHPNIVQFIGVHYSRTEELSLIMEFLPMSLEKCIDRCNSTRFTIPVSCKLSILLDVVYGLLQLHKNSIIHRDLSAANILLTSDLRAKIADLGMSRILTPEELRKWTRLTKAPGAQYIMPPETMEKDCQYNNKMDIFSFGIVALYLMLQEFPEPSDTGLQCYNVSGEFAIGRRIGYVKAVAQFCNGSIRRIICACLKDSPESRPTASQLKDELEQLCRHYPSQHGDTLQMLQTIEHHAASGHYQPQAQ